MFVQERNRACVEWTAQPDQPPVGDKVADKFKYQPGLFTQIPRQGAEVAGIDRHSLNLPLTLCHTGDVAGSGT